MFNIKSENDPTYTKQVPKSTQQTQQIQVQGKQIKAPKNFKRNPKVFQNSFEYYPSESTPMVDL